LHFLAVKPISIGTRQPISDVKEAEWIDADAFRGMGRTPGGNREGLARSGRVRFSPAGVIRL
jgi:hypothetical protein